MKKILINKLLILVLLSAFAFSKLADAASLGVWPINPRIDAPASSTLVWIKNNSQSDPIILQARILLWRQVDNSDQFEPQDDLVVSPPIIEVKPDAQQIFRVMNRKGVIQNVAKENSYRLLIDEVPKEGAGKSSLLRFQMRYSLPLFVGIPQVYIDKPISVRMKAIETGLKYRVVQQPAPLLEVINQSQFHARISNLTIQSDAKSVVVGKGLVGYVLPNSVKQLPLNKEQLETLGQQNVKVMFEQEHQELTIVADK